MEFPKNFALFLVLALVAEVLGTIGGFGSSAFFVPIGNIFLDFKSVLGITAVFHLSSNISKLFLFRKGLDKGLLLKFGVPGVLGVVGGGLLSGIFDETMLSRMLGGFLILMSLILMIFRNAKLKPTTVSAVSGGAASGFLAGILGTGGAVRGIALASFALEKEVFVATSAAIDLAIDASRTIVYASQGYIGKGTWIYIPFLLVIGWVGSWLGKVVIMRISNQTFRYLVLASLLGMGVVMLLNWKWEA